MSKKLNIYLVILSLSTLFICYLKAYLKSLLKKKQIKMSITKHKT